MPKFLIVMSILATVTVLGHYVFISVLDERVQ